MTAIVDGFGLIVSAASKKGLIASFTGSSPTGAMPKYLSYLSLALFARPKRPISTMSCCMAIGSAAAMIGVA